MLQVISKSTEQEILEKISFNLSKFYVMDYDEKEELLAFRLGDVAMVIHFNKDEQKHILSVVTIENEIIGNFYVSASFFENLEIIYREFRRFEDVYTQKVSEFFKERL